MKNNSKPKASFFASQWFRLLCSVLVSTALVVSTVYVKNDNLFGRIPERTQAQQTAQVGAGNESQENNETKEEKQKEESKETNKGEEKPEGSGSLESQSEGEGGSSSGTDTGSSASNKENSGSASKESGNSEDKKLEVKKETASVYVEYSSIHTYYENTIDNFEKNNPAAAKKLQVKYNNFKHGSVLVSAQVEIKLGDTAMEVLKRACSNAGVSVSDRGNYVAGIGNLFEFDFGRYSGWKFMINGSMASRGAGSYSLKDGDSMTWFYHSSDDFA